MDFGFARETASKRREFSRKSVVLVAFAVVVLIAAVLGISYVILTILENARRMQTGQEIRTIVIMLRNIAAGHGHLPPATFHANQPYPALRGVQDPDAPELYSWRFPIMRQSVPYPHDAAFDQAWTAPANTPWRTTMQPFAYGGWDESNRAAPPQMTRVFAVTGPGTAFGDGNAEQPRSLSEIDGDTILLVEVRNSGVHWMEPGDFDIRTMPRTINHPDGRGISSVHRSGFHVAFADGSVWYLRNDTPFEELAKFFTVEGAHAHDRDTILGTYLHSRID